MNENETVLETMNEGVKETIAISGIKNLAYNKVVDALDQMIDAGKPNFLDGKKPKEVGGHEEACKNSVVQWFNCDKVGS